MASVMATKDSKDIESEEQPDILQEDDGKPKEIEVLFEDAFHTINWVFHLGGLHDFYKSDSHFELFQKLLYIGGLLNLFILLSGHCVTMLLFFICEENRILITSETFPCLVICLFGVAKTLLLIFKRKEVHLLVMELEEMWPKTKNDYINKIVRENMITAKNYYKSYIFATINVANAYNIMPILRIILYVILARFFGYSYKWDDDLSQPYTVWYPYNTVHSLWIYIPTFLSQCHCGIYVTGLVAAVDCFFCLLMAHVTMHFQLLHRQIRNLNMDTEGVSLDDTGDKMDKEIPEIVEYHNKLYVVTSKIEDIFSSVLFLNLAASSFLICLQIFCITIAPPDRLFKYAIFLLSSVSEISLMCYYGNRLTEESTAVRDAAYDCGWVDGGAALRTAVLMFQCRAAKPAEVSALGFTTASLGTLFSILQAAWSYFTLLHNLYDGDLELV